MFENLKNIIKKDLKIIEKNENNLKEKLSLKVKELGENEYQGKNKFKILMIDSYKNNGFKTERERKLIRLFHLF